MSRITSDSRIPADSARFPSLRDKRVFITGGGSGIGACLVDAFARQGARVAFVDIDEPASVALVARLSKEGLTAPWWQACDVRDVRALQAGIRSAAAAL